MKTTLTSSIASLGLVLLFGTTAVGEDRTKVSLPEPAQATEQVRLSAVSPNAAFARLQAIPAEALTSHEMAAIQGKFLYIPWGTTRTTGDAIKIPAKKVLKFR